MRLVKLFVPERDIHELLVLTTKSEKRFSVLELRTKAYPPLPLVESVRLFAMVEFEESRNNAWLLEVPFALMVRFSSRFEFELWSPTAYVETLPFLWMVRLRKKLELTLVKLMITPNPVSLMSSRTQFCIVIFVLLAAKIPFALVGAGRFQRMVFPLQSRIMLLAPNVMHESFTVILSFKIALELRSTGQPVMLLYSLKEVTSNSSVLFAKVTF